MDKPWIDGVIEYSNRELELNGFSENEIGYFIIDTIIKLQKMFGNKPMLMKSTLKMMSDLIDKKPVSPITENDFENDWCTRCEYIYKGKDGKYYNDRAVGFKKTYHDTDTMYICGENGSKKEITLPYVLREDFLLLP